MVEKNEILKMAKGLDLNPDTVEKDYILGWMLYGINNHYKISEWAFKGGTSLKKCFFETYRFSEDLDFTIIKKSHLNENFLLKTFKDISDFLYEKVGIEFFNDRLKFKIIEKINGKFSAQGKIYYNGPLQRKKNVVSIKLDLTNDEVLVLNTQKQKVHHPYTDEPKNKISANCYSFEEVIAEKIRALGQRARPRDLYDVIQFFRNRNLIDNPILVYNVLQKKCSYKKIQIPTYIDIQEHEKIDELKPQWKHMLTQQLPHLPPYNSYWQDLPPFFDWLNGHLVEDKLVSISEKDEIIFHPGRIRDSQTTNFLVHKIQFAAANRVCIKLRYHNKTRTVEPISFRTARSGNRLFYGFERNVNHPKAYSTSEIQSVEITNIVYKEKYPIEINTSGFISIPPTRKPLRISKNIKDRKFVYKCQICGKIFYRKKRNSKLNPHKNKDGKTCYGQVGILID